MTYCLKNRVHVAVPTAFFEDESLNVTDTIAHILYLQDSGIASVLVCGSTGEQHSLTLTEKITLLKAIEDEPRIQSTFEVLFGISCIRQKEAIILAKTMNSKTKIAGVLLGFPPYILPSQKEAMHYAETIIQSVNKPILIYNNPKRTGFNLTIESLCKLLQKPNVVGFKEAGENNRVPSIIAQSKKNIYVYAGGEVELKEKVQLGFNRLSSIAGNLFPLEIVEWFESLLRGKDQNFVYQEEVEKIFVESPLTYLKSKISKTEKLNMGLPRSPLGNK